MILLSLISFIQAVAALSSLTPLVVDTSNRRVVVIAHRAAHEDAPENSLAAIREAIRLKVDYVELDVRLTKDLALVLMHDGTVDGTSNGKGRVADLTLHDMKALRLRTRRGQVWDG